MKFSGMVWSDHGTTRLHFWSIPRNRVMPQCATRGQGLLCFCTAACFIVQPPTEINLSTSVSMPVSCNVPCLVCRRRLNVRHGRIRLTGSFPRVHGETVQSLKVLHFSEWDLRMSDVRMWLQQLQFRHQATRFYSRLLWNRQILW